MQRPFLRHPVTLLLMAAAVLAIVAFAAGRISGGGGRETSPPTIETTSADASPTMYTCSMHPSVRSPNPNDKCPICGMDLIPVPSDEGDDDGGELPRLSVSPRAAALMEIRTWPVERRAVAVELPLYGRIEADETRRRTITAWVGGRLERLHVDITGARVEQGQPMVEIYSPELISAQAELIQATGAPRRGDAGGRSRLSDAMLEATRTRLRQLGLEPEQIAEIEQRGEVSENLTIHAPVDGVVIERRATQGDYVERGDPIYELANLDQVWVELGVFETDMQALAPGQPVSFTAESWPGETFEGEIAFIDPTLDPQTRTVRVRADIPNPEGRLRPGMFVRGTVHAPVGTEAAAPLVIPATAPLLTGRRAVVYVRLAEAERPTFEAREVTLGPRAGEYYVVQAGLAEGELVVTNGNFKIDSELQIRGRPSMMAPEGGGAPTHQHGDPAMDAPAAGEAIAELTPVDVPAAFRQALDSIYAPYIEVQEALARDDLAGFHEAAPRLHAAVDAIDASALEGEAARVWARLAAGLTAGREHVTHFDIEAARAQFEGWSEAIIELGRRFGHGGSLELWVAYCPMTFGNRGSEWLQVDQQIFNPYFGATMLRCGEFREQLAADPATVEQ